jgi:hypothetical protein
MFQNPFIFAYPNVSVDFSFCAKSRITAVKIMLSDLFLKIAISER